MSDLDTLLKAKDDFAFLGLEPQFPLTPVRWMRPSRVANQIPSATPEQASQLRQRLSAAKQRLANPVQGRYLLALLSGVDDPGRRNSRLGEEFDHQVAAATDPASANALKTTMMIERQARLDHIATVFAFPRDIPNRVSQNVPTRPCGVICAIEAIDQLLAKLT